LAEDVLGMKGMEMIAGTIVMEDVTIHFMLVGDDRAQVTVGQTNMHGEVYVESYECSATDFTKALAIAVHHEGMPNAREEYDAAERAMGEIRWIP
jgi:hypothetical protein